MKPISRSLGIGLVCDVAAGCSGLGTVALTCTKGNASLNDVISLDDFNNAAAQITNTRL